LLDISQIVALFVTKLTIYQIYDMQYRDNVFGMLLKVQLILIMLFNGHKVVLMVSDQTREKH